MTWRSQDVAYARVDLEYAPPRANFRRRVQTRRELRLVDASALERDRVQLAVLISNANQLKAKKGRCACTAVRRALESVGSHCVGRVRHKPTRSHDPQAFSCHVSRRGSWF